MNNLCTLLPPQTTRLKYLVLICFVKKCRTIVQHRILDMVLTRYFALQYLVSQITLQISISQQ